MESIIRKMESEKNKLYQYAEFWRDKEKALEEKEAIVIIDNIDDDVNKKSIELLPLFIKTFFLEKVMVLTSSKEITRSITYSDIEIEIINREVLLGFNKCQRLLGSYNKIYTNISEYLDDGNPLALVDSYELSKEDIIAKVFFEIDTNAKRKDYNSIAEPKIASSIFKKHIPLDRYRYRTIREFLEKRINGLEKEGFIRNNNHIVVYGDSYSGLQIVDILQSGFDLTIVDRDKQKHGEKRYGVEILPPEEALLPYNPNNRILIAIYSFRLVCEYLYDMGYELGKEVFIMNYKEDIRDYDDESLRKRIKYIYEKGEDAYCFIRHKYRDEHIFLSPWSGSGDLYLSGLYLADFIKRQGIDDFVIVSSSKSAGKIAKLMGYKKVVIIEQDRAFDLLALMRVFQEYYNDMNLINTLAPFQRLGRLSKFIDTNTYLQRTVFDADTRHTSVVLEQKNSDVYFEKYSLQRGKTALVAPYSVTSRYIPIELCNCIVDKLLEKGYNVCTNIGTGEKALDRTLGLQLPYECIIDFVSKAGLFIGIRSGLCDIISSTSAEMIVFYQQETYELYSLKRMGLKIDNILEIVIDGNEEKMINAYLE